MLIYSSPPFICGRNIPRSPSGSLKPQIVSNPFYMFSVYIHSLYVHFHISHPQIECLSQLYQAHIMHCVYNFCSLMWDSKISFSFFTVSRIEALTTDLSNCTIWFLFFPYFKSRTFAFSLKGSTLLSGLSELPPAWLLCSGAIRKRNEDLVTTAPWRHTWSDTWEARSVTGRRVGCAAWAHWTKGWFTFQAGQRGTAWDFISPLRTVCSLKRLTCLFLEFSISYFQMTVDHRQLKLEMRPWIRGEYLAGNRWLSYQLNGRRNENFRDLNNGDHHLVDQLDIHCLLLTVKVPTAQIKPFLSSLARTIRFYIGFANSSTHICFVLFCCIPVSSISEHFYTFHITQSSVRPKEMARFMKETYMTRHELLGAWSLDS